MTDPRKHANALLRRLVTYFVVCRKEGCTDHEIGVLVELQKDFGSNPHATLNHYNTRPGQRNNLYRNCGLFPPELLWSVQQSGIKHTVTVNVAIVHPIYNFEKQVRLDTLISVKHLMGPRLLNAALNYLREETFYAKS